MKISSPSAVGLSRLRFVQGVTLGAAVASLGLLRSFNAWAVGRHAAVAGSSHPHALSGTNFALAKRGGVGGHPTAARRPARNVRRQSCRGSSRVGWGERHGACQWRKRRQGGSGRHDDAVAGSMRPGRRYRYPFSVVFHEASSRATAPTLSLLRCASAPAASQTSPF